MMYYDAIPENQGPSSSSQRWLHSNELKMDNQLKIASTIRSVFLLWSHILLIMTQKAKTIRSVYC